MSYSRKPRDSQAVRQAALLAVARTAPKGHRGALEAGTKRHAIRFGISIKLMSLCVAPGYNDHEKIEVPLRPQRSEESLHVSRVSDTL